MKTLRIPFVCMIFPLLAAADWPQFRGPNRDGASPETGLLTAWPKKGPALLWDRKVGDGFSGPVIQGDKLILLHRLGDKETVDCLDPATGKQVWRFDYPTTYQDDFGKGDGPRSTPLIAGQRVYTLGADGHLHCLDLTTGKKVWDRSLNSDYHVKKGFFGVATSPILEGNLLLVNVGGDKAGIVALDKDTGKEVWKATSQPASYSSPLAATLAGQRSVFFFTRTGLVALEPTKGTVRFEKRWRSRLDASVNAAAPVLVGDQLFLSAEYGTGSILLRVKPDRAEEIWQSKDALSNHYNTSIALGGYLYGIHGRQEAGAKLRAIDLKTGKVQWTREGFGCASLILADNQLLALTEAGDLVLIDPSSKEYREKARATLLTRPCRAEIALSGSRVFARDGNRLGCWKVAK